MELKLSRLAYEAIKEAITVGGSEFSYDSYTRGEYLGNQDYEDKESKVWGGINSALARLSDYDRLPHFCTLCGVKTENGTQRIAVPSEAKEIVSVFSEGADGYSFYPFSASDDYIVLHRPTRAEKLYVEYSKTFPHFSRQDIVRTYAIGDTDAEGNKVTAYTDNNIDLGKKYNLTNEGFQYAKTMAEAEIMRIADPARANDLLNIAENYFIDMREYRSVHSPRRVGHVFGF